MALWNNKYGAAKFEEDDWEDYDRGVKCRPTSSSRNRSQGRHGNHHLDAPHFDRNGTSGPKRQFIHNGKPYASSKFRDSSATAQAMINGILGDSSRPPAKQFGYGSSFRSGTSPYEHDCTPAPYGSWHTDSHGSYPSRSRSQSYKTAPNSHRHRSTSRAAGRGHPPPYYDPSFNHRGGIESLHQAEDSDYTDDIDHRAFTTYYRKPAYSTRNSPSSLPHDHDYDDYDSAYDRARSRQGNYDSIRQKALDIINYARSESPSPGSDDYGHTESRRRLESGARTRKGYDDDSDSDSDWDDD